MKVKSILLFLCCLLCVPTHAQQTDVASKLQQAYRILSWDGDFKTAENLLADITESDVVEQSDTTKYLFYYCNAGLMDMKEVQSETKTNYIRKAIALREQSLGIHDSEYIELLCALATELEDADPDAAIPLYEQALVVGMYPFYLKIDDDAAKQAFGRAMWNLAHLYEVKGYEDQLISLYRESFNVLSANYQAGDATSYIGLYQLSSYYAQHERYKEAISTINEVLAYIEANEGRNCSGYISASYMLASFYAQSGDLQQAISRYKENIQLTYDTFGRYDENLDLNYGNLYAVLIDAHQIEDADSLLYTLEDYYKLTDNYKQFVTILYNGVVRLEQQQLLSQANIVCDRVIEKMDVFSAQEKEVVLSKKAFLCFCLDKVDDAIQWKEQAIKYTDNSDKDTYVQNLFNLAFLYGKSGDFAKSLVLYIQLKDLLEQESMEMQNLYINTVNEIYGLYEDDITEAEKVWRECTAHIEAKYNRQNATYAHSINGLGCVMLKADRPNDALSCFRKGQKVLEQLDMENSDAYAMALHNVGRAYMLCKRYKQAKNCLEQAKALQIQLSGNVFERTEQYLSELESLMNK